MNARTLPAISVALNLVLMVTLACHRIADPTADIASPVALPKQETGPAPSQIVRDPAVTVTNRVVERLDWRSVESEDYQRYIANLRSIGCPE